MKINEFKKIAEENDYTIERRYKAGCEEIVLYSNHYGITRKVAVINNRVKNILFLSNGSCKEEDLNMIKASIKFAETPIEDREEEKKYYLKHRWLNLDTDNYLHLDVDDGSCMLDDNEEFSFTKTKLTEKEIEEIKEKFNTDLADFELVEVVEEIEK